MSRIHVSTDTLEAAARNLEQIHSDIRAVVLPDADVGQVGGRVAYGSIHGFVSAWGFGLGEASSSVEGLSVALMKASKTYRDGEATVTDAFSGPSSTPGTPGRPGPKPTTPTRLGGPSGGGGPTGTVGSSKLVVGQVTQDDLDSLARQHGWDQAQIADWVLVIKRESGGETTAQNPNSSAYGIAQFINGPSEYAEYGGDSTTVIGQLTAMANYIKSRYGTPSAAWQHEIDDGWY